MDKDTYKKALEMLRSVKEGQKLSREQMEKERRDLVLGVSKDIAQTLAPSLEALANQSRLTRRDLLDAISEININVNAPEVNIPTINVPQPKVSVFPPEVKVPEIKMPDEMNIKGWVSLMGVDLNNPLPVQLRDGNGNPVSLFENLNQFITGGGGGFRRVIIDNNSDHPVPVTGTFTVSSSATTASVPTNNDGVTYNSDNPLPVAIMSGASATSAVNVVDSSGVAYSGSNPVPVGGSVTVSGSLTSVGAYLLDGEGNYRDTMPISGTVTVSGSPTSVIAVGAVVSDAVDGGSAPIKQGGIARTANPTAVANGDIVSASYDKVGRQLVKPVQVRDLLKTAYVTEDEVEEVSLLAGVAGEYHDLVYVMCSNESTAAINLDFRQTTGGTVQMSVEVPANGTAGISLTVPIPQDHADATWTVKNSASDNSNTVYSVTALFSKEK